VNDAHDWAALLENVYQFDNVRLLLESDATRQAIIDHLAWLLRSTERHDTAVVTFSGHGTWARDEPPLDEQDGRDEAWCAWDDNLVDDDLRKLIERLPRDAHLTVVSDSCYAGTVSRGPAGEWTPGEAWPAHDNCAARFAERGVPWGDGMLYFASDRGPLRRLLRPRSAEREVLLSACAEDGLAFEARIDGRFNGALTSFALASLRENPTQTYRQLHAAVRKHLPSVAHPQVPQLEGSDAAVDRMVFRC
jgi:hypothetical protein